MNIVWKMKKINNIVTTSSPEQDKFGNIIMGSGVTQGISVKTDNHMLNIIFSITK